MSGGEAERPCSCGVLGGTFSLLHAGHRFFLYEAWRRSRRLVVGVTSDEFVRRLYKKHPVEPYEVRALSVLSFLLSLGSGEYEVVPLDDKYGPAVTREDIDCIFVSEETFPGAVEVNLLRRLHGLKPLKIYAVELKSVDGERLSSTILWRRMFAADSLRESI